MTHSANTEAGGRRLEHVLDAAALALFAALVLAALLRSGFMTGPLYGDERHFFASAVELAPFRIEKLAGLREISTPTFFIVSSFVVQLLGPQVFWLRLAVLCCLIGCVAVHRRLARRAVERSGAPRWLAPLSLLLLLTFPYFVGCGVYYYTDIPGLLFALLAYDSYQDAKAGRAVLWATLAVHCRQYFLFIPVGAGALEVVTWLRDGDRGAFRRAAAWSVPILSLAPYFVLWRGPSPMRSLDARLAGLPWLMPWHVTYLLAALGLYLLPVSLPACLLRWRWWKGAAAAAALAAFLAFPPRQNVYYEMMGSPIATLGFLDVALRAALGRSTGLIVLALGAGLGAALLAELAGQAPGRPRTIAGDKPLGMAQDKQGHGFALMVGAFWVMNLFSHLAWEKYLLPVLPLVHVLALRHAGLAELAQRAAWALAAKTKAWEAA